MKDIAVYIRNPYFKLVCVNISLSFRIAAENNICIAVEPYVVDVNISLYLCSAFGSFTYGSKNKLNVKCFQTILNVISD